MNSNQERLVYTKKEAIASRDMVLFQASQRLEFIAPKPEPVVPRAVYEEQQPLASQTFIESPRGAIQPSSNSEASQTGSEELDRAANIARLQQQVEEIRNDIEAESEAA